jgi:hypothetical protein
MQRYTVYLYLETAVHISGVTSTHHQERIQLYLQHLVFVTPLLLSAAIVGELEPDWVCCGTFRFCVCSFIYPAHNERAPCCLVRPLRLCNNFTNYLIKGKIFSKKSNIKCVLTFSTIFCEAFLNVRRGERDMIINVYWSLCEVPLFLLGFKETWIFSTYIRKVLGCKISWKSV